MRLLLILPMTIMMCGAFGGCMPGTYVKKNPGKWDKGIRYYRPKPYLFVSPSGETKLNDKGQPASISPSDRFVNIELKYMPDYGEEYSLRVIPGIGSANVTVTLDQGWNLTAINQTLDTQLDENITAVSNLIGRVAPGGLVGTEGRGSPVPEVPSMCVAARNIPLGFYESVIGEDQCGRKQIYGWRYVGFAPFNTCPTYATGACAANCEDGTLQLYGLVFENEVMVFKPLLEVAMIPSEQASCQHPKAAVLPAPAQSATTPAGAAQSNAAFFMALRSDILQDIEASVTIGDITMDGSVVTIPAMGVPGEMQLLVQARIEEAARRSARKAGVQVSQFIVTFE